MKHVPRGAFAALAALTIVGAPTISRAAGEEARVSLVRQGGGIVVADGVSVIPMQLVLEKRGKMSIKSARVTSTAGKVRDTRVVDAQHVSFLYAVPKRPEAENLEITLTLDDGERTETFPFRVPAPAQLDLELDVDPPVIQASDGATAKLAASATASGADVEGVAITAAPGRVGDLDVKRFEGSTRALGVLEPGALPVDEPSYVLALAAAASEKGFAARAAGVAVEAPVRLSVEIPPKSVLTIEGASREPAPVTAPADGRTVVEDVLVRYGAKVRAFAKKGGKKTEVSVAIPGTAPAGAVLGIPGQTFADGGTGPTIAIAVPPPPFGGEPFWPEITIDGAELVQSVKVAPDVRVLYLKRPAEPTKIGVFFDEQIVGVVELGPRYGQSILPVSVTPRSGERAAVELVVRDASGLLTDVPMPRARLASGPELPVVKSSTGKWRVRVPAGTAGAIGAEVKVLAELPTPAVVAGDPIVAISTDLTVTLAGPPPPVRADDGGVSKVDLEPSSSRPLRIGVTPVVVAGATFNGLTVLGGGVMAEARLPVLDGRLAVRLGLEYARASGTGALEGGGEIVTTIAGLAIPVDAGFALVSSDAFELLVRAGVAVRFESGALELDGTRPGGNSRTGIAAHASIEGAFGVGPGALVVLGTVSGIGASAAGFSSDVGERSVTIDGALTAVRAEAGYRFWF
ncbi:hypothetical protein L6R52_18250 [Myxococcota bacterium]|nr:hypothetical protein [Myxococcota bacterium]